MVRRAVLSLLACLIGTVAIGAERFITVDELRLLSGDADRGNREKAGRIQNGDLSDLVASPQAIETPAPGNSPPVVPDRKASKYTRDDAPREPKASRAIVDAAPAGGQRSSLVKSTPAFEYVPPPRASGDSAVTTDAVAADSLRYGIRVGSWIEAELLRDTSNAELGVAAFRVIKPAQGRYRELEVGTELFAEKRYNDATQRLELVITSGVTPAGKEFAVRGVVHDVQKVSGLHGIVKKKDVATGGVQTGLLAATRATVNLVANDNPLGAGANAAANTLLSEGEGAVSKKLADEYVIYVSRQSVKIFVSQSF
ncbi:MAG: hypothetical protein FD165_2618 [Gammaproteobacteria bacterium]|nr:MAG: hypothetical protein FD165_2618 [Gammaproteobacteria bacterium]TND01591.1 MAG: hypothetical protein FD120_2539 [Gammaproteobacteria bacterium]